MSSDAFNVCAEVDTAGYRPLKRFNLMRSVLPKHRQLSIGVSNNQWVADGSLHLWCQRRTTVMQVQTGISGTASLQRMYSASSANYSQTLVSEAQLLW